MKKRSPRPAHVPQVIKIDMVLRPVEQAIEQILETGYTDTVNGKPVLIYRGIKTMFSLPDALHTIDRLLAAIGFESKSLSTLANKLKYDMPLTESNLTDALESTHKLRTLLLQLTPQQAHDLVLRVTREEA